MQLYELKTKNQIPKYDHLLNDYASTISVLRFLQLKIIE
jgi:hypothetical protein